MFHGVNRYQLRSRAPKVLEETDEPDIVREKVRELANMIRSSKYAVVSISTAS
jgi:hypothetical protein